MYKLFNGLAKYTLFYGWCCTDHQKIKTQSCNISRFKLFDGWQLKHFQYKLCVDQR